jgi:hypothetical protein
MRFILIMITMFSVLSVSPPARPKSDNSNPTLVYPPWKHTLGLRRVGQRHLDFYSGYRKTFDNPQGMATVKLDFNDDAGPGDDEELTIYGVNSGTGEVFYNKSMVSAGFFGRAGSGAGEFHEPVGIAADRFGNVVVADTGNRRVVVLRNVDNELEFVRDFNTDPSGNGAPTGVALEDSILYVADKELDRVLIFDLDGRSRGDLQTVDLKGPFAVAVISSQEWNYFGSRFIVVTDSLAKRLVQVGLDDGATRIRRYREVSGDEGGFNFAAIDFYGNIYVTDTKTGCILKFDRLLNYVTRVGCGAGAGNDLDEPRGITIHRRFGQVFVAEREGASYYWVGADVKRLKCAAAVRSENIVLDVEFFLTEYAEVTLFLVDDSGKAVHGLLDGRVMAIGSHEETFSVAQSDLPCTIANCTLRLAIEARATYSSKKYHSVRKSTPIRID